MSYKVFSRTWWRQNPAWPNGLEPHAGRKKLLAYKDTESEARKCCAEYAKHNKPGPLSRKAEYEKVAHKHILGTRPDAASGDGKVHRGVTG